MSNEVMDRVAFKAALGHLTRSAEQRGDTDALVKASLIGSVSALCDMARMLNERVVELERTVKALKAELE